MFGIGSVGHLSRSWAPTASRDAVTVTAVNGSVIDSSQYKYGTSSLHLDRVNTNAGLQTSTINIGTGDFTLETWCRMDTWLSSPYAICYIGSDSYNLRNQAINFFKGGATYGPTALPLDTWHHLAWVRYNGTLYLYANGVLENSVAMNSDYTNVTLLIGQKGTDDQEFDGWLDEFRVSGVARYTAGFTPPGSAFTNDSDTLLLLHFEGPNGTQTFTDDNT